MLKKAYKKDQGRLARMAAFWSLAFLVLFGSMFLYGLLYNLVESLQSPLSEGLEIPVVSVAINGAFVISSLVCVIGVWSLYNWQQTPKVADLLIETEGELRKVTWPTMQEVINSSMVVVLFVVILMGFLAGTDWFLGRFFSRILLGS